ncbi:LOW QUALITY PROTEIN: 3-ketodihydrosphingosine reductase [Aphomia sociella]
MFLYIAIIIVTVTILLAYILNSSLDKKTYRDLKQKHVVITGGSSGIGKAAAIEAAKLGAHVTIIGRDVEKLKLAINEITSQCLDRNVQKIQYASLDVTSNYESIAKCLATLEADVAPIFMLVNCAGMCICGKFEDMKAEDIKLMIDLNYFGTAYPTKYVLSGMKKRNEGLIVFVASEAAFIGIYGYSAYSGAKWALRGLAESIQMELVGTAVRLTVSFPPDTDTPGFKNEELTKPKETKLISGSAGLHSPEEIGKELIHDAMNGKIYSVYSTSGKLLSLLFGGSVESTAQVLIQVLSMGFLRAIMVNIILYFNKIVKDELKEGQKEDNKKK